VEQPVQQVAEELCCPLCGYDLRGISEPRCPECGYAFEWEELRDPTRRLHPYLFEHHPHRPVWAFVRTLVGGLLPWRFWGKLHPMQPLKPRGLVLYWLIVVGIAMVPAAITYVGMVIVERSEIPKVRYNMRHGASYTVPMSDQDLDRIYPEFPSPRFFVKAAGDVGTAMTWVLIAIVWPWVTLGSFLLLRTSMRRAQIKFAHVLRCSMYGGDVFVWGALLLLPFSIRMLRAALRMDMIGFYDASPREYAALGLGVLALLVVWRLFAAYRKYLRLPHALAVAVLLQVLVWLGVIFALAGFYAVVRRRY
jgi:hypothetical protein